MSSCRGDGRGSSVSMPQVENKKYQSVGTRSRVSQRGKRSRVPRKYMWPLQRPSCSSYVLGTDYYMLLKAVCTVLFALHVAAFELHSCGCASSKRLETA